VLEKTGPKRAPSIPKRRFLVLYPTELVRLDVSLKLANNLYLFSSLARILPLHFEFLVICSVRTRSVSVTLGKSACAIHNVPLQSESVFASAPNNGSWVEEQWYVLS
jgi:hypothetical protein